MKKVLLFLIFCSSIFSDPSIVFIHIGNSLPPYLPEALIQARYFNSCPIYLIANAKAFKQKRRELQKIGVICIPIESLQRTKNHTIFSKMTAVDTAFREGFWMFTIERFFFLYEFMKSHDVSDVFHLEYDNMLYADVSKFLPTLKRHYENKIAATFDNDSRCIAGLIYISNKAPLKTFLSFVAANAHTNQNDMELLAQYKNLAENTSIDNLPIIPPSYADKHTLVSDRMHTTTDAAQYSHHFDEFQSIFDAAALGQFLGGIDPRNGLSMPGFINESCLFNPAHFQFEWTEDSQGRLIPMMVFGNEKWPIVNLHIHSKNLNAFSSKRSKS
ncbi:MAG: hypothetical protein COT85_06170 [Chlamydiae bacterium CG10_big_fil_rev_8_21_14_0_10_42_34]|nr:MAG: hypothetical protein COT85_06170 [Chlamydiae bacterium CG10_big_fil_rev_8_21_14_0_10_42_34]